jgi:hypothetical protein
MKITENLGEFQKCLDDDSKTGFYCKNRIKTLN